MISDAAALGLALVALLGAVALAAAWAARSPDPAFAWNEPVEIRPAGKARQAAVLAVGLLAGGALLAIAMANRQVGPGAWAAGLLGLALLAASGLSGLARPAGQAWLRCDAQGLHGPHGTLEWADIARLRGSAFTWLPGRPLVVELNDGSTRRLPLPRVIQRRAALSALYSYARSRTGVADVPSP